MGDTIPDILRIVEEDIKEVIKEVKSLEYESLSVVAILIAAFVFSYFVVRRKIRCSPPAPSCLPDVGYLPFMKRNIHLDLIELGMKYGDVFSMSMGSLQVVFLQGAKAVEEAFSISQLSGHPPEDIVQLLQNESKFFVKNIHQWEGKEEYVTKTMKEFDIKLVQIDDVAKEELNTFVEVLTCHKGKPIDLKVSLSTSVFKTISALIIPKNQEITKRENSSHSHRTDSSGVGSKENKKSNNHGTNPFQAGSETVVTSILWCMYVIAAFPDVQEKVRKEILDSACPDRQWKMEDMKNMLYTQAVIMEVLRWKTIIPLNAMRYSLSDVTVNGYHIPRGAVVIANFWNVHNDPNNWIDPDNFNPGRFLDKHGSSVIKPSSYMPFSTGESSCPGETLSFAVIFLYFTSMVQKFRVELPEGIEPNFEANLNVTYSLNPYRVRFVKLT